MTATAVSVTPRVKRARRHTVSSLHTVLVALPFAAYDRPSIGFASLRGAMAGAGLRCEILHPNIEFARRIGLDVYDHIAFGTPTSACVGDLVFVQALHGPAQFAHALSRLRSEPGALTTDDVDLVASLADGASRFIESVTERVLERSPSIVGVTTMFHIVPSLALAAAIKAADPSVRIVLGGAQCEGSVGADVHATYDFVDFVCTGEGEEVLPELVSSLGDADGGADLAQIPHLVFRDDDGNNVVTGRAPNLDMDALPTPTYHDWVAAYEQAGFGLDDATLPLESSRGCWFGERSHCTFCGLNGESIAYRQKSGDRVAAEIFGLAAYGIRRVLAVDPILSKQHLRDVLPNLPRESHGLSLFYEVKSNLSRADLRTLRTAGVDEIQPGIESLDSSVLRLMRKGVLAYQNVRLLRMAAEEGITVSWNLLYGFPYEDPDAYRRMAELVPLLRHLEPPRARTHLRLDRFSPLYQSAGDLGVRNIRPCAAYPLLHPGAGDRLAGIATYFEFDRADGLDADAYVGPLVEAIDEWQRPTRRRALVSYDLDGTITVLDSRWDDGTRRSRLDGVHRLVLIACDSGARRADVAAQLGGAGPEAVGRAVDDLLDARVLCELDGRLLALPVALDGEHLRSVPDIVRHAVAIRSARSPAPVA